MFQIFFAVYLIYQMLDLTYFKIADSKNWQLYIIFFSIFLFWQNCFEIGNLFERQTLID